jgi:hypothetical protein
MPITIVIAAEITSPRADLRLRLPWLVVRCERARAGRGVRTPDGLEFGGGFRALGPFVPTRRRAATSWTSSEVITTGLPSRRSARFEVVQSVTSRAAPSTEASPTKQSTGITFAMCSGINSPTAIPESAHPATASSRLYPFCRTTPCRTVIAPDQFLASITKTPLGPIAMWSMFANRRPGHLTSWSTNQFGPRPQRPSPTSPHSAEAVRPSRAAYVPARERTPRDSYGHDYQRRLNRAIGTTLNPNPDFPAARERAVRPLNGRQVMVNMAADGAAALTVDDRTLPSAAVDARWHPP